MEDTVKKLGKEGHAQCLVGIPKRESTRSKRFGDETSHGGKEPRRITPSQRVSEPQDKQERGNRARHYEHEPGEFLAKPVDECFCRNRQA